MAIRKIVPIDHPILTMEIPPSIWANGSEAHQMIKDLGSDMFETCLRFGGMGLAANQVGANVRMFVMIGKDLQTYLFINPEIVKASVKKISRPEGCLSMPSYSFDIERSSSVEVRFQNHDGVWLRGEFHGEDARCVQHEIDHLNGIRHIDHLGPLKRKMALDKFHKEFARRKKLMKA